MDPHHTNYAIVTAIRHQGMSVTEASQRFGRSRQWIYTLLSRYDTGGKQALIPHSKKPQSTPTKISSALRVQICSIRKDLTRNGSDNGPASIAFQLARRGLPVPSESTLYRVLREEGLITPEPKKRPKSSYTRFEAALPNECWQSDVTTIGLRHGHAAEVLNFLDDHSRYLLYTHAYKRVTGAIVVEAMQKLIDTYGAPYSTLTDNGMVYTTRLAGGKGGKNGFEKLLATHHIRQKNGSPHHPQTQGKIERFHQTLKKWIKARPTPDTIPELQKLLDEFTAWYNTDRPHRSLHHQTPQQAYHALPKTGPEAFDPEDHRVRHDKVDKAGRITLRWGGQMRYLGIGRKWAGTKTVTVINDDYAVTADAHTGEVIAEHRIDPQLRYQKSEANRKKDAARTAGKTQKKNPDTT